MNELAICHLQLNGWNWGQYPERYGDAVKAYLYVANPAPGNGMPGDPTYWRLEWRVYDFNELAVLAKALLVLAVMRPETIMSNDWDALWAEHCKDLMADEQQED